MDDLCELNARLAASNIQGLAELVREMRLVQSSYFKTRSPMILDRSKQLEKMVDRAIIIVLGDQKEMAL